MNATITAAPLPTNFKGTPQQWLEAFLDRLEVSFDGNTFVISDVQPIGNQGPWLKNGTQWWVWDDYSSEYIPLDVSASVTNQIFIGDIANGAPDPTVYQLWLQLNGTVVNGLFYYEGSIAGWVKQAAELVPGAVQLNMLAPQAPGSLITFDINKNPTLLAPGNPGSFLQSTGAGLTFSTPTSLHGIPTFINPVTLVANIGIVAANTWSTISTLTENGVPTSATAIILAVKIQLQDDETVSSVIMRPSAAGSTYVMGSSNTSGGAAPNLSSFNQGIYPFLVVSGVASFDWAVDTAANYTGSSIVLIGYIS